MVKDDVNYDEVKRWAEGVSRQRRVVANYN
jgi:hypothetical protein